MAEKKTDTPDETPVHSPASTFRPAAIEKPATYIILGDKVGPWLKGTAVTADQFADQAEVDRLLASGAIGVPGQPLPRPLRLATPAEQTAYNEARRAAFLNNLVPPLPPEGILFDANPPEMPAAPSEVAPEEPEPPTV